MTPELTNLETYCHSCEHNHAKGLQVILNLQPGRLSVLLNLDAVFNIKCYSITETYGTELATWRALIETDVRSVPVLVMQMDAVHTT